MCGPQNDDYKFNDDYYTSLRLELLYSYRCSEDYGKISEREYYKKIYDEKTLEKIWPGLFKE